jgi:glyoxylase-like metal-dependent hydrolase (beta-lactamase superfamily II)
MEGAVTVTKAEHVNVHTYLAPETGWRVSSHLIELPTQLVLVDAQLTAAYARELLGHAVTVGKPVTRCYISHAHPDHFTGASLVDAPTYAVASQRQLINESGDLRIDRAYRLTPGHWGEERIAARPVDHAVEAGEEVIDGVRFRFQPVRAAETTEQLTIGLPDERILIAQDVVYHDVHSFIAEHDFTGWDAALNLLESWPYDIVLAGHGEPGDRRLYAAARAYLTAAQAALAAASGPDDLSRRLESAYPGYGGRAMQGLQNFYLYPPAGR